MTYLFTALRFIEDENIFDRVYWYLSPFPVKEGALVLAPVGSHNRLQLARVERTLSAGAENAPYDMRLIKKTAAPAGARKFPCFCDCRDLGGLRYDGKRFTRYRVFLRSVFPACLSQKERELCARYNVTAFLDFRTDGKAIEGAHTVFCPLREENLLESEGLQRALTLLAEENGCILFGGEKGTAATGVVTAILLLLAGVREAEVLSDFLISETDAAPIDNLFAIVNGFGGIEGFLSDIGMNAETIKRLKEKLK